MRAFTASFGWRSVSASWNILGSHDSPRIRTTTGSADLHHLAVVLQFTLPGVPMVFAGDELGFEGEWGEDARRTIAWDREDTWDSTFLSNMKALIGLRRSSDALSRGGIRFVHVSDDAIAFLRETRSERLLCLAARASHEPIETPFTELETLFGEDAARGVLPSDGPSFHIWKVR